MSQKLNSLKNQGKVAFWSSPKDNSLLDKSGNGSVATPTDLHYANTRLGRAANSDISSSSLSYTHTAEQGLTEGVIIVMCGEPITKQFLNQKFFDKVAGTGQRALFYATSSSNIAMANSGTASILATSIVGKHMLAVRYKTGKKPEFFVDGVYKGLGNQVLSFTAATGALVYASSGSCLKTTDVVWLNDSTVSDEDISIIYNEYMNERGVLEQPRRGYLNTAPPIEGNCALAYDMETRAGGQVADLSGNSNNATISGGLVSSHLFSDLPSLKNSALGNLDFSALTLGTKHTIEFVADGNTNDALLFDNGTASFYAFYYVSNTIRYLPKAGVGVIFATGALDGKEHHFIIDRDDTSVSLYMDGNLISTETLASNETFNTTTKLTHDSFSWQGNVGYAQIYTVSKGATWAAERYAQYAKHPLFLHDMNDTPPTLANVTSGKIGLSEFQVSTGTWKVSEDPKPTEGELLIDGDMEAVGTAAWRISSAIVTKETDGTNQFLRVENTVPNPSPRVAQTIMTAGKKYRVTGKARGDGSLGKPDIYILGGAAQKIYAGDASTSWADIDVVFVTQVGANEIGLYGSSGVVGHADFDDISVVEVGEGKKWIENVVAGVAYTKQDEAYGTYVFDVMKALDAGSIYLGFITSVIGAYSTTGQNGYYFGIGSSELVQLGRAVNGVWSPLAFSPSDYVTLNTAYKVAITRGTGGVMTMYIKGGTFTEWTLITVTTGTNPYTDNTHTTSKFAGVSLGAGDKFRMLGVHEGVLTISELSQLY